MKLHARARILAMAALVVFATTSCVMQPVPGGEPSSSASPDADHVASSSELADLTTPAEVMWSTTASGASGSPVVIDDRVVTYEINESGGLQLSGFDVQSGDRVWSEPASSMNVYRGMLSPSVLETADERPRIVSIAPTYEVDDGEYVYAVNSVLVLDPATGETVASFDETWASELIGCSVDNGLCFWHWDVATETSTRMVVTGDGEFLPHEQVMGNMSGYAEWREMAGSTFAVRDSDGSEWVVKRDSGTEVWRTAVADLGFPHLLDSWINSNDSPDDDVLVLQSNGAPTGDGDYTIAAGEFSVAIVNLETGQLLRRHDASIICGGVHLCTGDITLESTRNAQGAEAVDMSFADVTLTKFDDMRAGAEGWSRSFSELPYLPGLDPDGSLMGWDAFIHVRDGDRARILDGESGALFDVGETDVFGCLAPRTFESYDADLWSEKPETLSVDAVAGGCTLEGPAAMPGVEFTVAVARGVGGWTWRASSVLEEIPDDDPYRGIEFVPVHTEDALMLFRR